MGETAITIEGTGGIEEMIMTTDMTGEGKGIEVLVRQENEGAAKIQIRKSDGKKMPANPHPRQSKLTRNQNRNGRRKRKRRNGNDLHRLRIQILPLAENNFQLELE